ncbi:hypothetical protein PIB30_073735 [Stylosanthes scabra]|uniref:Uncharacterized protein n=1 Tax=Stylosanthes scabra TaxID=79078 RepID=A0ABU6RQ88_9FABA|nr:hypothetical protein [Stylosanthes scabra]
MVNNWFEPRTTLGELQQKSWTPRRPDSASDMPRREQTKPRRPELTPGASFEVPLQENRLLAMLIKCTVKGAKNVPITNGHAFGDIGMLLEGLQMPPWWLLYRHAFQRGLEF